MKIDRLLIIPDSLDTKASIDYARKHNLGFEFNDFYQPELLDDNEWLKNKIKDSIHLKKQVSFATLHGAFYDVNVASADPKIARVSDLRINQSLSVAQELGIDTVIFHTNYIPNFYSKDYCELWINKNVDYWGRKLIEYSNINIYIENMFDISCEMLSSLAKILSAYPNFGVCLDFGHMFAFGNKEDANIWVQKLMPYVRHIHINDNDLVSDLHLPLGDGKIDWKFFKAMYERYFDGIPVLIEVNKLEDVKKSLLYIKEL